MTRRSTTKIRMTPTVDGTQAYGPAGFWRRVLAAFCDGMLLLTAALVLFMEMLAAISVAEHYGWVSLEAPEAEMLMWMLLGLGWWCGAFVLLPILYFTVCEGACGQTFGKGLYGLVVVSAEGQPIGYGRAFARLLTLPYSVLPAGLGLLWIAVSPTRRAWHDYISATRVVCPL
jgi:uncharacterized RDD family membrane protein YckC